MTRPHHLPRSVPSARARRLVLPGLLATAMIAGACTNDDGNAGPTATTILDGDEIALTSSGLETVDSCDALLDRLIAEGVERVGPYGFNGNQFGFPVMMEGEDMAMEESAETSDSGGEAFDEVSATIEGDGDFSGTNNQEGGVDEPDLVKTDGKRLVVASGDTLQVIDVETDTIERSVDLPRDTWAEQLFLTGDSALVMTQGWTEIGFRSGGEDIYYPGGSPTTRLIDIDITTGEVNRTLEFEGNYLSARDVDGTARIVLTAGLGRFDFLYPSGPGSEDRAEEVNRELIEESTIEQWLPTYRLLDGNGDVIADGDIAPCDRVHIPNEFSGFGTIALLTIDLESGLDLQDQLAVLSDGQTIYASTDRLAVATTRYPEWDPETGQPMQDESFHTAIHTFDITDENRADYVASGAIDGHLINQYAMSERDGLLRVATTEGDPWWGGGAQSESFVTVLDEVDGALVPIGSVGGLGLGEQIFAVRFIGDIAYVVTFEQVDPLYTVDMSDPTAPVVRGELKIPGFSTYLHPVGDGLLLGVGQDATDEGFQTGAQVSSFDVSDLDAPTRTTALGLGDNSYSAVDWDKLAFTWWGPTRTAFVPISWWNYDEQTGTEDNGNASVAIRVGEDGSLTEVGRISHVKTEQCESDFYEEEFQLEEEARAEDDAVEESGDAEAEFIEAPVEIEPAPPGFEDYCWSYQPEIRRTVIVNDRVYTISEAGVQVNELDGLGQLEWLPFER